MRTPLLLCLGLAGVLAGAGEGAAQELPPSAQDTIPTERDTAGAAVIPAYVPPRLALSLTVGRPAVGDLQWQPMLAERTDLSGAVLGTSTVTRSVRADGGFSAGISGLVSLGPVWAVRLGVTRATATLETGYESADPVYEAAASAIADRESTRLTTLTAEGVIRFRMLSTRVLQPYMELGAVAVYWSTDEGLASAGTVQGIRYGVMAGLGAMVPLTDRFSGRVQATTLMFGTTLEPTEAGTPGVTSSALTLTFQDPVGAGFADAAREVARVTRLELGITAGFGSVRRPPPDPSGTAAPPPPPSR